MHHMTKSPAWFFAKAEEPDREIREEEIERIDEFFDRIRFHGNKTKKSREKSEKPCHTIFCLRFFVELGEDRYRSHEIDKGIRHEYDE